MILLSMLSWLFDDNGGQPWTTILVKEIKECCLLFVKKIPRRLAFGGKEDILYLITIFVVVVYPLEDIVQK